jgi:opacity protein-like surface antigen
MGSLALLWCAPSMAQDQGAAATKSDDGEAADKYAPRPQRPFDRDGFYLGLAANYSWEMFDIDEIKDATNTSVSSTNAWGLNGRFGYRFHPHLAAELEVDYLPEFEFEDSHGLDWVRMEGLMATANGKVFILKGRVQPYVLAGGGIMYAEFDAGAFKKYSVDRTEAVVRGGPGVDVYLWDDILLNTEVLYVVPFGGLDDFQMLSVIFGAQYRF